MEGSPGSIEVLLVDDEPDFLDLAEEFLEKEGDISVETTTSAREAMEMVRDYDVLVSDYKMPEMDGLQLLEAVRNAGDGVPFIVFTGKGREDVAMDALNLGADRYVQKGGKPGSQFAVLADAIEQEYAHWETEWRVRRSEREKRAILNAIPEHLTYQDTEGRIIWTNESPDAPGDVDGEGFVGELCYDAWFGRDDFCPRCPVRRSLDTGEIEEEIMEHPKSDRVARIRATPVRSTEDEIGGALELVRDVTEERDRERRLKLFSQAIEEAPDGIQIVDLDGYVEYSNKAVEDIYGFTREELRGINVNDMNADPEVAAEEILPATFRDGGWNGEILVRHREGHEFPIWLKTSLVRDEDGDPIAMIGIIRDLTRRRKVQERQEFLQSLLRHDVRNKNGVVHGYLELLKEEADLPDPQRKLLNRSIESIRNSINLVEKVRSMLDYVDEGETQILDSDELFELVENAVEKNRPRAEEQGIDITTDLEDFDGPLNAGPIIENVVSNLVENAITHARCSEIRIWFTEEDDGVTLTVEDDGIGVPEENKEKVFQKEYTDKPSHTGMGLYLIERVIESYGGDISLRDGDDGGARFDIRLNEA